MKKNILNSAGNLLSRLFCFISLLLSANIAFAKEMPTTLWSANTANLSNPIGNEIVISNEGQFAKLAELVNNGRDFCDTTIVLSCNLDLSSRLWIPIGNTNNPFGGELNGAGHSISGLYIDSPTKSNQGLFGCISGGSVKDLGIETANITGNKNVGAIAGKISRTEIENCYNEGFVTAKTTIGGGLIGYSDQHSTINNCHNSGYITGESYIGGIAGKSDGLVSNSYNTGDLYGLVEVGGIVAYSTNYIANCYNLGNIDGTNNRIGGILGYGNYCMIANCYSTGIINGANDTGSIVGYAEDVTIEHCYFLEGMAEDAIGGGTVYGSAVSQTETRMKGQGFVNTLNDWVEEQEFGDYFKWNKLDDLFPSFSIHTLRFDINNADGETPASIQVAENAIIGELPNPLRKGYQFEGWHIDNKRITSESIYTYDEDKTAVAHWTSTWEAFTVDLPTPTDARIFISEEGQLAKIAELVNSGRNFKDTTIILLNDLYLSAHLWIPIGNQETNTFHGTFDGRGYVINGININRPKDDNQGLFGCNTDGVIKNTQLEDIEILGKRNIGGIAGKNAGTIVNCVVDGELNSTSFYIGGMVGYNEGDIFNCHNAATINGKTNGGGIAGYHGSGAKIGNCFNTGSTSGTGAYIAAVIGESLGEVENCYYKNKTSKKGIGKGTDTTVSQNEGEMKSDQFVKKLNDWVFAQSKKEYVKWKQSDDDYPQFAIFKLFFDINCADLTNPRALNMLENTSIVGLPSVPNRFGYTFKGWELEGKIISNDDAWEYNEDKTAVAIWEENSYILSFNKNGGTGTAESKSVTFNNKIGELPKITRKNYIFKDWEIDNKIIAADTIWNYDANKTAKAHWIPTWGVYAEALPAPNGDSIIISTAGQLAKIAIDVNNGRNFKDSTIVLEYDVNLSKHTWIPIGKTASTAFEGTFDGAGNTISGMNINDTTLSYQGLFGHVNEGVIKNVGIINSKINCNDYAGGVVAKINGTIRNCHSTGEIIAMGDFVGGIAGYAVGKIENTFNESTITGADAVGGLVGEQGASSQLSNCYNIGTITGAGVNTGAVIGKSQGDVTSCYHLNGSAALAVGNKDTLGISKTASELKSIDFTKDLNDWVASQPVGIYAKWKSVANDYPFYCIHKLSFDINYKGGKTPLDYKEIEGLLMYLPTVVRTGYTFLGWYIEGVKVSKSDRYTYTTAKSAVAHWRANSYTLSFNKNGGTGSANNKTVTYDLAVGELPILDTREHYTFNGWKIGNTTIKEQTIWKFAGNKTAIAAWVGDVFQVTFDANGGEGTMDNQDFNYGTEKAINPNKFSRAGYLFIGWATVAGSEDVVYKDKAKFTITENTTLYAVWKKDNTGVDDTFKAPFFIQKENTLVFEKEEEIKVFNSIGKMMFSGKTTNYELPNQSGVYIICCKKEVAKVIRR